MGSGHHVGGDNTNYMIEIPKRKQFLAQPGCFILILKLEYPFYAPPHKVARVLCYVIPSEILSVHPSVLPSFMPTREF